MSAKSKKRKPGQAKKKKQPVERTGYRYCGKPSSKQMQTLNETL